MEVKLKAERKAGQILKETSKQTGGDAVKARLHDVTEVLPKTLKELGIEKIESHRWQQIAAIPDDKFDQYLSDTVNMTQARVSPARSLAG